MLFRLFVLKFRCILARAPKHLIAQPGGTRSPALSPQIPRALARIGIPKGPDDELMDAQYVPEEAEVKPRGRLTGLMLMDGLLKNLYVYQFALNWHAA